MEKKSGRRKREAESKRKREREKKTYGQTFIPRGNGQFCYETSNFVPIELNSYVHVNLFTNLLLRRRIPRRARPSGESRVPLIYENHFGALPRDEI